MQQSKKVLMIAYVYHPIGGAGSVRSIEFSRFLPEFGWTPIVLSCESVQPNEVRNTTRIPKHVKLYHAKNLLKVGNIGKKVVYGFGITKQIVVPDHYIGWILPAFLKAKEIVKKEKIDVIYVSCNPFSSAIVGYLLKIFTRKPLIIDLRDAWTLNPYLFYKNGILQKVDTLLERAVIKKCNLLITTSYGAEEDYNKEYPFTKDKSKTIFNGFNEEILSEKWDIKFNKFTLSHVGKFYGVRTPELLLKAVGSMIKNGKMNKEDIEILFVGEKMPFVAKMVRENDISDIVQIWGYVSHKRALEIIFRSHMLLLVQGFKKREDTNYIAIAGKTFEYLVSGTPILSLTPEGDNTEIIRDYSTNSYVITDNDLEKVSEAILDCYKAWEKGELPKNKKVEIVKREFTRRNQTKELADVFDRVAGER